MFKDVDIEGYFMNHSCRRTGNTHLFQAGVECKLIKEISGQWSDAVDAYSVTSEAQKANVSKILEEKPNIVSAAIGKAPDSDKSKVNVVETGDTSNVKQCTCGSSESINIKNVGMIVDNIMSKLDQKGKTVIKLQIEISNDK